jgi:hypothetical protein
MKGTEATALTLGAVGLVAFLVGVRHAARTGDDMIRAAGSRAGVRPRPPPPSSDPAQERPTN